MLSFNDRPDFVYNEGSYTYQPALTRKLNGEIDNNATQEWINEVVLWKVNRYAELKPEALKLLNNPEIKSSDIDKSFTQRILKVLLNTPGMRLPMASTVLRFRNPHIYQIIDQRAYRVAIGKPLVLPVTQSDKAINETVRIYFEYLDRLKEISVLRNWPFEEMDKILYVMDKEINGDTPIAR